jgi:hypothetical protein
MIPAVWRGEPATPDSKAVARLGPRFENGKRLRRGQRAAGPRLGGDVGLREDGPSARLLSGIWSRVPNTVLKQLLSDFASAF